MADPVITHVGRYDWVDTPSLVDVPIGAVAPDRILVFAAGMRRSATPSRLFTSFTVDGRPATIIAQVGPSNVNVTSCIAAINYSLGSTATILIEANGVYTEGCLDIYAITGANSSVYDIATQSVDVGSVLLNLDIPGSGVVVASASLTGPATDPVTWTGLAYEGSDAQNGAQFRFSSAYQTGFSAQSRAIAVNNAADREALVAVSWGIAAGPGPGPGRQFTAAQSLPVPDQILTIQHPRQFTYARALSPPYQSGTASNAPPRAARKPPLELPFNSLPVPTGELGGNTVTIEATKDVVEKLIGTRGDGSKRAVLQEDITSPQFIAQYANPIGVTVLIPATTPLPKSWAETAYASPIAGMRYIQKL